MSLTFLMVVSCLPLVLLLLGALLFTRWIMFCTVDVRCVVVWVDFVCCVALCIVADRSVVRGVGGAVVVVDICVVVDYVVVVVDCVVVGVAAGAVVVVVVVVVSDVDVVVVDVVCVVVCCGCIGVRCFGRWLFVSLTFLMVVSCLPLVLLLLGALLFTRWIMFCTVDVRCVVVWVDFVCCVALCIVADRSVVRGVGGAVVVVDICVVVDYVVVVVDCVVVGAITAIVVVVVVCAAADVVCVICCASVVVVYVVDVVNIVDVVMLLPVV